MESKTLEHHGIMGMKWGVRRYQNKDGTLTAAGKRRAKNNDSATEPHADYSKAHEKKSVKSMSDAELRNKLNRLNMEKQYSQLSSKSISRGKDYASKILKTATTVATATTTALTIYNNFEKIKTVVEKIKVDK